MKKQFFAKRWCLGLGIMVAATACQPRAADAQRNSSSKSSDGDQRDEDDEGDDGAYGDNDQSTQVFEIIEPSSKDQTEPADSAALPSSDTPAITSTESVPETMPVDSNQTEKQESLLERTRDDAAAVAEASSADPRLEAVEAVRIISENYQESSETSSQK